MDRASDSFWLQLGKLDWQERLKIARQLIESVPVSDIAAEVLVFNLHQAWLQSLVLASTKIRGVAPAPSFTVEQQLLYDFGNLPILERIGLFGRLFGLVPPTTPNVETLCEMLGSGWRQQFVDIIIIQNRRKRDGSNYG